MTTPTPEQEQIGDEAWAANPFVVAITFTAHHGNIDKMGVEA